MAKQKHYVVDLFILNNTVSVTEIQTNFDTIFVSNVNVKFRVYDQGTHPEYFNQYTGAGVSDIVSNVIVDVYVANNALSLLLLNDIVTALFPINTVVQVTSL